MPGQRRQRASSLTVRLWGDGEGDARRRRGPGRDAAGGVLQSAASSAATKPASVCQAVAMTLIPFQVRVGRPAVPSGEQRAVPAGEERPT